MINPNDPHCPAYELHRQSENGSGPGRWCHSTHFKMSDVTKEGYFRSQSKHHLVRFDTIYVVAEDDTGEVEVADLLVTSARVGMPAKTSVLWSQCVDIDDLTPYEILGISPDATVETIKVEHNLKSKGADDKRKKRLDAARDDAMKIAGMRAA